MDEQTQIPSQPRQGQPASAPLLLTGATGFVGMQLLARYLERTDRRVYALIRARDQAEADARLRATLTAAVPGGEGYADRVVAVPGDVTLPGLGLAGRRRDELAGTIGEIVHAAASVSFTLPLDNAREINVEGTRRVLQLAQACAGRGGLRRFSYVSTAYVAGTHRGRFGEEELEVGQRFRNSYERSKFEAERLVRAHRGHLPIQVFRPSIVVGEEQTGWTPTFNVIYWPMRAFSRGAYSVVPARRSAPVDVVSISFVADAIFELTRHEWGAGETYNLAAGPRAASVGELIELCARHFERRAPVTIPPALYRRLAHPLLLRRSSGAKRIALEQSEAYFPYFEMRVRYDTEQAARRLAPAGVEVTPVGEYFGRLIDYAVAARWGRHPRTRSQVLAAAPSAAEAHRAGRDTALDPQAV